MFHWLRLKLSRNNMRWLYDRVYYNEWISGRGRFFNVGIAPVDGEVRRLPFIDDDEDQAQVYYEILKTYRKLSAREAPRKLLELSTGLGGGISLLRVFCPTTDCYGLDLSLTAVRRATAQGNLGLCVANLLRAPFGARQFDLIVGVEASPGVQLPQLFVEPARMLSADGILILVDTRDLRVPALREMLSGTAQGAGLAMVEFVDLTARLLEARNVKRERNLRVERLPLPGIRRAVREMSVAAGSDRFERYARGELTYSIAAFVRADQTIQ